jgi:hypothetical protein
VDVIGSRRCRAALLGLVGMGIAVAPAAAVDIPHGGPFTGVEPFPGAIIETTCTPPDASAMVRGDEVALPHSITCSSLEITTGVRGTKSETVDAASLASPPLFVVKRGTVLRFHFTSPPSGAVRLEVRRGPHLRSHATYRLSPFSTVWRARGTGGVMTLSVPFAPATTPWSEAVPNDGVYTARFVVR